MKIDELNNRLQQNSVTIPIQNINVPGMPNNSYTLSPDNPTSPVDLFEQGLKDNQALRYNEGKLQWSMIDFKSLEGMVKVLEMGAQKYSRNNWKLGMPVTQVCESLMRHLFAFMSGEDKDPESGESHMSHVLVNAMFVEYIMKERSEFDDRKKD